MRANLILALERGEPRFPGIVGYDKTALPQIENAILSGHDFILLGLRGQAKTRILRSLSRFLDEWVPAIEGCEIHDDPLRPICPACQRLSSSAATKRRSRGSPARRAPPREARDARRDDRGPDRRESIDQGGNRKPPSDPEVMHYGIIPRTNRGIFAINELPDLQPRIQVGLLNILEEKDIQIRGFPIRLPLDLQIVFSANPEDYTNRGNIITPLRDRIASQIMTHYPYTVEDAMKVTEQEAWVKRADGIEVVVPPYIRELVEQVAIQARKSSYVDQSSGVSVRLTIAGRTRFRTRGRAILGTASLAVRICDLQNGIAAITGRWSLVVRGRAGGRRRGRQAPRGQGGS
jgi:magnesium chelatase subunit I